MFDLGADTLIINGRYLMTKFARLRVKANTCLFNAQVKILKFLQRVPFLGRWFS